MLLDACTYVSKLNELPVIEFPLQSRNRFIAMEYMDAIPVPGDFAITAQSINLNMLFYNWTNIISRTRNSILRYSSKDFMQQLFDLFQLIITCNTDNHFVSVIIRLHKICNIVFLQC